MDVRHPASTLHEVFITFTVTDHPARDGFYGHGLISAHSLQGGAMTWLATAAEGAPIGRAASRADVHFLRGPQMGTFDIRVDGETLRTVDTSASAWEAGFADVRFPDGPHVVKLVVQRGRSVRFFGMALERDTPGVVLDALGVGMLNCRWMLRENATTFRATLARRAYDLIVFHLGTMTRPADYAPCMDVVVGRIREALPNVSILVMSPPDFPDFDGPRDPPRSAPWVAKVRDTQRRYAAEHGLAFFDFFEAMGGNASMSRFRKEKMEVGDSTHFNEKGGDYMGRRVVYAIWRDFARWLRDHPSAGCANETAMAPAR